MGEPPGRGGAMSLDSRVGRVPTRADVAGLAGTSLATVSYVVNDGPRFVSAETKARVQRAIEQLGYRPDPVARSFRGMDSDAIGMMVPNFRGPFFADLVAEVERQAGERGKIVLFGSTAFDPTTERKLVESFTDRRVQAILAIGTTNQIQPRDAFNGAVNIFRPGQEKDIWTVEIAQRAATRDAAEHLLGHGRKRLAAIFGPTSHGVFKVRYRGWRDATGYRKEETKQRVRRTEYSFQGGYDATIDLFTQKNRPDGLLATNDTQAIGALSALHTLGLSVPEDVAVVSIDSTALSPFLVPALTSVRQPTDLIVKAALDIVGAENESAPRSVRVPHTLELRESCGCATPPATPTR